MTYDLHDVPFSTFGSYMSVSALTGGRASDGEEGIWVERFPIFVRGPLDLPVERRGTRYSTALGSTSL